MNNRIRWLRKQKGLTMKQLGAVLGLAESTISQYENGHREPDLKTITKLADCFGVTVDYLLNGSCCVSVTAYTNGICVYEGNSKREIEDKIQEKEPGSFKIVFRSPSVVITVDNDSNASEEQINSVISIYNPENSYSNDQAVRDMGLKFALWGGADEITDEMLDEVRRFAEFVRQREEAKKNPPQD